MLNYEEFREVVTEEFENYFPEELKNCLVYRKVTKVNEELDAVSLCSVKQEMKAGPTLYISNLYFEYQEERNLDQVLKQGSRMLMDNIDALPVCPDFNRNLIKKNVFFQLINREKNREMLKNVVHRDFLDLSIIYRVQVKLNGNDGTFIIQSPVAEKFGFTEEDLYNYAMINTQKLYPFVINSMGQMITKMREEGYLSYDIEYDDFSLQLLHDRIYVITNMKGSFGAHCMLFSDFLDEVAETIGGDFYILPSSLHEIIVLRVDFWDDEKQLWDMVKEVNTNHVAASEVLSDSVYKYLSKEKRLTVAKR